MALLAGSLIIVAILALLGGVAQAWGVDSRVDSLDSHPQRVGLR
jgi:hypothetical protein